jgi:hypothetical protein
MIWGSSEQQPGVERLERRFARGEHSRSESNGNRLDLIDYLAKSYSFVGNVDPIGHTSH